MTGSASCVAKANRQLHSGEKMAAYSRALLQLLLSSVCLCGFGSVSGLKAASGPAEPPNAGAHRAAEPQLKDAPAAAAGPGAGASQARRATGWKLSEEEACREDLTRLCPKHTWTNNLAVLECLQDRREVSRAGGHLLGVSNRCFGSPSADRRWRRRRRRTHTHTNTHRHTPVSWGPFQKASFNSTFT